MNDWKSSAVFNSLLNQFAGHVCYMTEEARTLSIYIKNWVPRNEVDLDAPYARRIIRHPEYKRAFIIKWQLRTFHLSYIYSLHIFTLIHEVMFSIFSKFQFYFLSHTDEVWSVMQTLTKKECTSTKFKKTVRWINYFSLLTSSIVSE